LDSLADKTTPKAIRLELKTLRKESEASHDDKKSTALDHAYVQAMERIESQEAGFKELAKKVLSWITCAKRPLTILELRHALAVEVAESELDEENIPEPEDMVFACAGLITVDQESDIIRLVHYTTQEYFERTQTSWYPDAQRDIAMICVTYLSFDVFENGFCPTDKEFETRLQLNPLYNYAARNWGYHARAASTQAEQLIVNFLESKAKVSASSQAMMTSGNYRDYSQRVPRQMTGVHLGAYFGLKEAMITLLKNGLNPNLKDTYGRTPLSWAAENGHETVVRLLLATDGVDPDSRDSGSEQTPLSWAAENGHESIVRLLLAKDGIDPDSRTANGRTPLSWAARNGHEAVVRLLLATDGVDPDFGDSVYRLTPLSWAARNGHEAVVRLLLATDGVDLNSKHPVYRQTPLSWAAENGHEAIVRLLLEKDGIDPDSKTANGRTPLSWAARNGHEAVVRLLLAKDGVDANTKDMNSRTPLSRAAERGHCTIVKLLLAKNGVDANTKDNHGRTPLSWATENGHEAVVRLLLAKDGVDANTKDMNGRTPLSRAAERGHCTIVKLLLAKDGIDRDSEDDLGQTPFWWAIKSGHKSVIKMFI
jgi:ankyrin repeat protein